MCFFFIVSDLVYVLKKICFLFSFCNFTIFLFLPIDVQLFLPFVSHQLEHFFCLFTPSLHYFKSSLLYICLPPSSLFCQSSRICPPTSSLPLLLRIDRGGMHFAKTSADESLMVVLRFQWCGGSRM